MNRPLRNTLFGFCLCAAVACFSKCHASDGDRLVYGAGSVSCGEWQKFRTSNDKPNSYQVQAWIDGYLSGFNSASDGVDFLEGKPNSIALYAWVDNYCALHPLDLIFKAAWLLKKELIGRAAR